MLQQETVPRPIGAVLTLRAGTPFYEDSLANQAVQSVYNKIKAADFIAWDESFLDIIGPQAKLERIQTFEPPYQVHEAPVYLSQTNELLYSDTSIQGWLYAINVDSHEVVCSVQKK